MKERGKERHTPTTDSLTYKAIKLAQYYELVVVPRKDQMLDIKFVCGVVFLQYRNCKTN